mmetsp:Transcript_12305/g.23907  ORF Transcript_12305/g.23907 Transcript_12305/m.23907 type:complete len:207 (+) Transcript_12305:39-659(+)
MVRVRGSALLRRAHAADTARQQREERRRQQLAKFTYGESLSEEDSLASQELSSQATTNERALQGLCRVFVSLHALYAGLSLAINYYVLSLGNEAPFPVKWGAGILLWMLMFALCVCTLVVPARHRWALAGYSYGSAILVALAALGWVVLPLWQSLHGKLDRRTGVFISVSHGIGCLLSIGSALLVSLFEYRRTQKARHSMAARKAR